MNDPPDIDISPWILPGGSLFIDICPECYEKRNHIERYTFACASLKGEKVIDFGCGVGYGSEMLHGRLHVSAIDSDEWARTITSIRLRKYTFVGRGNYSVWPSLGQGLYDNPDSFVAFEVLEHTDDPVAIIDSLPANIKEICASVPVIPTVGFNRFHKHDFTQQSFRALIERKFRIVEELPQIPPGLTEPRYLVVYGVRE